MRINIGKKIANSTRCSQAVTHPSTNRVQHFLTSVTERGLVQQHGITVNRKFKSKNSLQFALWKLSANACYSYIFST